MVDWEPIRAALAAGLIVERQCAPEEDQGATVEEGVAYMHDAGLNCSAGSAADDEGWRLRMEPAPAAGP